MKAACSLGRLMVRFSAAGMAVTPDRPSLADSMKISYQARPLRPFACSGRRDDPIVIPSCSNEGAILMVLKTLKSWEHDHGLSFDTLTCDEAGGIGPGIHQVRFRRRKFTENLAGADAPIRLVPVQPSYNP